jgi:hypothetical protein
MKNLIIFSGIALALLLNSNNTSFNYKKKGETSQKSRKEIVDGNRFKAKFSNSYSLFAPKVGIALKSNNSTKGNSTKSNAHKFIGGDEPLAMVSICKINKTADQLIAEDNAITENNISNETNVLDFDLINTFYIDYETVIPSRSNFTGKTEEQLIAADNAITEQNISNKIQPLDYNFINTLTINNEFVEPFQNTKAEKTANERIAQDNLITDNNLTNETEPLNFELINRMSKS